MPSLNSRLLWGVVALALCGCPSDASKKIAEKERELAEAKAEKAKKDEQAELVAPPKQIGRAHV